MRICDENSKQDCINGESENMMIIGSISDSSDEYNVIYFGIPDFYSVDDLPKYIKFRRYEGDYITGVCRISLVEPIYIEDNNENFRLSENERDEFISILRQNIPIGEAPISDRYNRIAVMMTNWEWILEILDRRLVFLKEEPTYYVHRDMYEMPMYEKLPL